MLDCRIDAGPHSALLPAPCLTPGSARSAFQDGSASPLPSRARIFPGAAERAAGARVAKYVGKEFLSPRPHSTRSDPSGSILAARRAGIQHASSATSVSAAAITMKVSGSVALTSY